MQLNQYMVLLSMRASNVPPEILKSFSKFTVIFSYLPYPAEFRGIAHPKEGAINFHSPYFPSPADQRVGSFEPFDVTIDFKVGSLFSKKKKIKWQFHFGPWTSGAVAATDQLEGKVVLELRSIGKSPRPADPPPQQNVQQASPQKQLHRPQPSAPPAATQRSVAAAQLAPTKKPIEHPPWVSETSHCIADPFVVTKIYHRSTAEGLSRCAAVVIAGENSLGFESSEFSIPVGGSIVLTMGENSVVTSSLWRPALALALNGESAAHTHATRSTQTGDPAQLTARSPETALRLHFFGVHCRTRYGRSQPCL